MNIPSVAVKYWMLAGHWPDDEWSPKICTGPDRIDLLSMTKLINFDLQKSVESDVRDDDLSYSTKYLLNLLVAAKKALEASQTKWTEECR